MKDFIKSLLLFWSLPRIAKGSVYAAVQSLAEFYGESNEKGRDRKDKADSAQRGQGVCNGASRQGKPYTKRAEDNQRHGA